MKKILIVDDKKDNITSLKFLLEELSDRYQIITATSGAEALNKIEQILPDAILLDIKMPIMDGYEVCRRIRNNNSLSYIPIIFLTAHDLDIQSRIKGYNLGADDYITKPFDTNELFACINSALRIKFLQDELFKEKKLLEKKVEQRTKELIKSEGEIRNAHSELEMRVKERTAELERASEKLKDEIAERKKVEDMLRESEERYRRISETITDYIYSVNIYDEHSSETFHGPACIAVTGYTPKEFKDNLHLWIQMVHDKDRKLVLQQTQRILIGEKAEAIEQKKPVILHPTHTARTFFFPC